MPVSTMRIEAMIDIRRVAATTKRHSRSLGRKMTDAERLLWHHLRTEEFAGHKFRRQHQLGNFVIDFVCLDAALVLEIGGSRHAGSAYDDAVRTRWLQEKGLHVMRFGNNEVLNNIEGVKLAIRDYLSRVQTPTRQSSPEGKGAQQRDEDA